MSEGIVKTENINIRKQHEIIGSLWPHFSVVF